MGQEPTIRYEEQGRLNCEGLTRLEEEERSNDIHCWYFGWPETTDCQNGHSSSWRYTFLEKCDPFCGFVGSNNNLGYCA